MASAQHSDGAAIPPEYISAPDEWAVLQALAMAPDPSRAVAEGRWTAGHFFSAGAAEAFDAVASATAPIALTLPPDLAGHLPHMAEDAATATRARLTRLAQQREACTLRAGVKQWERDPNTDLLASFRAVLPRALEKMAALDGKRGAADQVVTLADLAASYWQTVAAQREAAPTGFGDLDDKLNGGLQPGRLMGLLGGPGSGKTTFANQIAWHLADAGHPVLFVTMEDTPAMLLAKTVARVGKIDYRDVQKGTQDKRARIAATLEELTQRQGAHRLLYRECSGRLSLDDLRETARAHFARYDAAHGGGAGLLIVDYLQKAARAAALGSGNVQTELRLAVSLLTDQLRDLARELDCTVLMLVSQNRASYDGNGGSALASAKESGDIEYGCDVLMALGKDTDAKRMVPEHFVPRLLTLAKNRQGPQDTPVRLDWRGDRQQFASAAMPPNGGR